MTLQYYDHHYLAPFCFVHPECTCARRETSRASRATAHPRRSSLDFFFSSSTATLFPSFDGFDRPHPRVSRSDLLSAFPVSTAARSIYTYVIYVGIVVELNIFSVPTDSRARLMNYSKRVRNDRREHEHALIMYVAPWLDKTRQDLRVTSQLHRGVQAVSRTRVGVEV